MSERLQSDIQAATDWFFHGEVGTSSQTICRAFLGHADRSWPSTPSDCDDLARCRLLLDLLSPDGRKAALAAVSERHVDWKPLVREWDRVCASMDAECPEWRKPGGSRCGQKTHKMMGVLEVEGLRLLYPKAQIEVRADGTLSSMFSGGAPSTVTVRADDFKKRRKKSKA